MKDVRDLALTLKKAFHIARTGRPGPVVVDIPKDVSLARTTAFSYPDRHRDALLQRRSKKGHSGQIRKAVQLLLQAKRPYIYTGAAGVILGEATAELRQLVDLLGFPCTNTLMGLGAMPGTDPRFLGMLGMHGTYEANHDHCSTATCCWRWARASTTRVIGNPKHFGSVERKIIHVDIDPSSISKRVRVDIPIVGDVKDVLQELIVTDQGSASQARRGNAVGAWWSQINEWRQSSDCLAYKGSDEVIKPQMVVDTLWKLTRDRDTYITSDVGQHQMWAAQFYKFDEPRRWINSGGLGTMGVGLPYAMGIKLAKPDSDVFCITGEGSIQMCIHELSTCLQYKTPVKIVSLNNRYLGMVRQWQELDYEGRYSQQLHGRAAQLREAGRGLRPRWHPGREARATSKAALKEAMRLKDRTVFLDIRTDPTENVWPNGQGGQGAFRKCCWARKTCDRLKPRAC